METDAIYVERDKLVRAEKVADIVRGERNSALEELARVTEERDNLQAKLDEAVDKALALAKERDALREKLERSIELPLDADGVPIRVGDVIESDCETPSRVTGMECVWSVEDEPGWNLYWGNVMHYGSEDTDWGVFPDRPSTYRHAKPRTVEDAVRDFVNSVVTFKGSRDGIPVVGIDDSLWRDYFDEFAEEIRELLEVK